MTKREELEKLLKSEPYVSIPSWEFQLKAVDNDIAYLSDYQLEGIKEGLDDYLTSGKYPKPIKDNDPL
ncbi:hypothetical protein Dxin01_04245 [Deinococcus xinjiangensis]|uniref:Uncharacterized protein n=1 Tax=Deinococcus xinjiangensis TaxID=457454 RepID=A0ABP9VII1_9DEIO